MIQESLNSRYDVAISNLEARTCHSWKMELDRSSVMVPPKSDLGGRKTPSVFIRSALGSKITDIDNNTYIDTCMGFGSALLGHASRVVERAIVEQSRHGWNFGLSGEDQLTLSKLIQQAGTNNQRVLLCNTESEASELAMRVARAYSGNDKIALFRGSFHGGHDYGLVTGSESPQYGKARIGIGVPDAITSLVEPLTYGSEAALNSIATLSNTLAAVVVEPVQTTSPQWVSSNWLHSLAETCHEHGVLLIFDESTTGFRLSYQGGQGQLGVTPDLTIYGKAIAGGLPLGALAGRASVMRLFSPGSDEVSVFSGSTFGGNPMSVAAGVATLSYLRDHGDRVYPALDAKGRVLAERLNTYWTKAGLPLRVERNGSILKLNFEAGPEPHSNTWSASDAEDAFFVHALAQGVAVHASGVMLLSTAHSDEDIDGIIEAFIDASTKTAADGLF